jgi:hypothetical protein
MAQSLGRLLCLRHAAPKMARGGGTSTMHRPEHTITVTALITIHNGRDIALSCPEGLSARRSPSDKKHSTRQWT